MYIKLQVACVFPILTQKGQACLKLRVLQFIAESLSGGSRTEGR